MHCVLVIIAFRGLESQENHRFITPSQGFSTDFTSVTFLLGLRETAGNDPGRLTISDSMEDAMTADAQYCANLIARSSFAIGMDHSSFSRSFGATDSRLTNGMNAWN
jgi:hypothetical protein